MSAIENLDIQTCLTAAVIETFRSRLSLEMEPLRDEPAAASGADRMIASLNFEGKLTGTLSMQAGLDFGRILAAAIPGTTPDEIGLETFLRDRLSEITTAIGGRLQSALNDAGYSCVLSSPSITRGADFTLKSVKMDRFERLIFRRDEHLLIVEVGLKAEEGTETGIDFRTPEAAGRMSSGDEPGPGASRPKAPGAQPAPARQKAGAAAAPTPEDFGLDILVDIPVELTVELGRTKIPINDLLKLQPGSAVKLAKLEGEPVDILTNDVLIARGEVVVRNEKYGIRITEITSRAERLKGLK